MSNYNKSLLALGLALLAVVVAAIWLRGRSVTLSALTAQRDGIQLEIEGMRGHDALIAQFETRMEALRRDVAPLATKFVGSDYETPQLVMAVVKSAGLSGMEMVNALKLEGGVESLSLRGSDSEVGVVSHQISLRGPYAGLVKFLQSMDAWDVAAKITSMEIIHSSLDARLAGTVDTRDAGEDEVDAMLQLSVFLLDD